MIDSAETVRTRSPRIHFLDETPDSDRDKFSERSDSFATMLASIMINKLRSPQQSEQDMFDQNMTVEPTFEMN